MRFKKPSPSSFFQGLGPAIGRFRMVLAIYKQLLSASDYKGTFTTNPATHRSTRQPTRPESELVWNPNQTFSLSKDLTLSLLTLINRSGHLWVCLKASSRAV